VVVIGCARVSMVTTRVTFSVSGPTHDLATLQTIKRNIKILNIFLFFYECVFSLERESTNMIWYFLFYLIRMNLEHMLLE